MKKQLKAISLLAGTAIGTGMISLPIVLAKFGIIGSLVLMIFFCWVTYVSAMVRCELNINSKSDFNLKDVGLFWGGRIYASVGDIFSIEFCVVISLYLWRSFINKIFYV
ncbi:MAG: hypothetical protein LBE97_02020 [Holosporales bacterium]|nr:hypothetical protein [Holosporales bacterium]